MHLLKYLNLNLDNSFHIFYEPFINGSRPDIVILKEDAGAIIIEVKDWDFYHYEINEKNECLDCFDYHTDIHNEYDLGYYWIEESGCYDLSSLGNLASYFDYERFGRDIALEQGGSFTDSGYICRNGEYFSEKYDFKDITDTIGYSNLN